MLLIYDLRATQLGEENDKPNDEPRGLHSGELEQALARVLAHAQGEVLNDADVQKFYQLYEEIQGRALAVTAA